MLCYTLLAVEFLLRFYFQSPFARRSSSPDLTEDSSENDKSWKAGASRSGAWLSPRLNLMVLGLAFATLFVFIRFDASISSLVSTSNTDFIYRTGYRTVELLGGWHGHIIRTQIFFNILDATPVCLALYTLNVFSPSILLRAETPYEFDLRQVR